MQDTLFKLLPISLPAETYAEFRQQIQKLENSDQWVNHINKKDYSGGWQVLPLRGLACHQDAHPVLQGFQISNDNAEDYINYPLLEQLPVIGQFLQQLKCKVLSARLMKLDAGARIKPHRDHGLCFSKGQARLHLGLICNKNVTFTVAGNTCPIQEGELWYLNADEPHSVTNGGDSSRIHLVIDCLSNKWLQAMIGLTGPVPSIRGLAESDNSQ